ncbi:hypothetical protein ATY41_10430 [Leifsonia xyli subsp. xyli]|uniref:Uncharacterized protein n=1 Tax=Leifsonia xyli subsp. xyli TaxID=59736 RepID=A0A1E2SKM9_LEIXY|nr:hypothetical protein ATY41_10430 [Leifsonia xyli subsp. xyli]
MPSVNAADGARHSRTGGRRTIPQDALGERDIPVIFGPILSSRSTVALRDREPRQADGGRAFRVAITTDHPVVPINSLVHQASFAVNEELPRRRARPGPGRRRPRDRERAERFV